MYLKHITDVAIIFSERAGALRFRPPALIIFRKDVGYILPTAMASFFHLLLLFWLMPENCFSSPVSTRITLHGLPAANTSAGISFITTLPATITIQFPVVAPVLKMEVYLFSLMAENHCLFYRHLILSPAVKIRKTHTQHCYSCCCHHQVYQGVLYCSICLE